MAFFRNRSVSVLFSRFANLALKIIYPNKRNVPAHRAKKNKSIENQLIEHFPEPAAFGEMLTADHKILSRQERARKGECVSSVIQDKFSYWLRAYPSKHKDAASTIHGFQRFIGPKRRQEHVYTDGSEEFKSAFTQLQWSSDTSTPYTPQTNGIAERAVRKTKEGTSTTLMQSGLTAEWWAEAQSCFCFLYCLPNLLGCCWHLNIFNTIYRECISHRA